MHKTVYLAGPITYLDYAGAVNWREHAIRYLSPIRGLSPMRAKEFLSDVKEFTMNGDAYKAVNVLSSNRGIMTRDHFDVMNCDVVIANLLGADRVSVGTVMEMAWCHTYRKPLIAVMEPEGNPHDHGMVNEAIGYRVDNLEEGLDIAKAVLTAYV